MLPRFLATSIDPAHGTASLDPDESHHLTHVVRLGAGDEVAVFDGAGHEYRARVERTGRGGTELRILEELVPAAEPAVRLTLAQSLLKGDRMDAVVRDATMMGAAVVVPVVTEHTAASRRLLHEGRASERWRRVAVASAKQCRRAVIPAIGEGTTFGRCIAEDTSAVRLLLVEPMPVVEGHPLSVVHGARPLSATILVGPEGGWSSEEVGSAISAGWTPITIGRRTLRADAVAIVAIGILQYLWGDL